MREKVTVYVYSIISEKMCDVYIAKKLKGCSLNF